MAAMEDDDARAVVASLEAMVAGATLLKAGRSVRARATPRHKGGGGKGAEAHEEAHEDAHVEALEEHAVAKEESLNRARSGLHPPEEHVAEHEQPRKQLLLRSGRSQRTNARGAHKTAESRDRIAKGHSVDG